MNKKDLQKIRAKVFNDYAHQNWKGIQEGNPKDFRNIPQVIDDVILLTIEAMQNYNNLKNQKEVLTWEK
jgi:hypothetical protein